MKLAADSCKRRRSYGRTGAAPVPTSGERYGVGEPGPLLRVHRAEADSTLQVPRRPGCPLTDTQADRCIAERRVNARLVGLDPRQVPANRAEPAAYFAEMRPRRTAGAESREADTLVQRPPVHPLLTPARRLLRHWAAALAHAAHILRALSRPVLSRARPRTRSPGVPLARRITPCYEGPCP
ncbi:oxygenase MpaB family protein [Streptomyces murinus]|uniref:oxygenase MpaB family protein n=1 Tax=Streptomyces murinus TaxID=33900 RepID=UPI000A1DB037